MNFSLIPKENKIFQDNFNFSVTGTLLKWIQDNMELATEIIYKHWLFHSDDKEYNKEVMTNYLSKEESTTQNNEDLKEEVELSRPKSLEIFTKLWDNQLKHTWKLLNGNNPNMIYWAVDVCRTCYITYSLMQEYFNEFHDMVNPQTSKWVHSE